MTRELLILRHGKSDWNAEVDDFHRPLKTRGIRGAQQVGVWLAQQELIPDLVVTSTAERARKTAEFTLNSMGLGVKYICPDERLYLASLKRLLEILGDCSVAARRVMLVGHNPGLEELVLYLSADVPATADGKVLPTATVARLQMPDDWQTLNKGCARLLALIRPAMLPRKFPYPDVQGTEVRERPAYYYRQAAALPYRVKDDGMIEFLILRSNNGKRWIIPKGIQDPGLTARETAAIEALEEAGIEGELDEQPLVCYEYVKWDGVCTVQVFPMRVTNILPDQDWQERHRGRKWVSAKAAIKYIDHRVLYPAFKALGKERSK
jgi:phosphohistidine phosphatase